MFRLSRLPWPNLWAKWAINELRSTAMQRCYNTGTEAMPKPSIFARKIALVNVALGVDSHTPASGRNPKCLSLAFFAEHDINDVIFKSFYIYFLIIKNNIIKNKI